MQIVPILVPYAGDVARWGAARGPAAIMQAGLADALRQRGHAVAEPVEIVFPRSPTIYVHPGIEASAPCPSD